MSQLRPPRGTHDLLGEEIRRQRHVAEAARIVAARYGYGEIATPVFEFTEVFQRTLGETSDIVTKEMYTFTDRGGDQVTLRPENTAGVVRAMITGGLTQDLPQRFFYAGPMFRYERPQKGRLRQFHQIGVELIGAAEAEADVEVDRTRCRHPGAARRARRHGPGAEHAGRPREPDRLPRGSGRLSRGNTANGCPRTACCASSATRCAFSTARTRATER